MRKLNALSSGERLTLADLHLLAALVKTELHFYEADDYGDALTEDYRSLLNRLNEKIFELETLDNSHWGTVM